ncbi:ribose-phosphate pyrophosphokinase-like domain-containing protein [Cupriavidus necator]|uniref:ribose-phosphate pyrophosphokinase-like domain-containing protein n=1 Tax=Cupriavidus necator TaxID=106590 RepID=UPI0022B22011|nr:ribose-phosphate pyrophosphokinase-like domain-containing protein [Cupriavidus necator]WKA42775.1 ribose-phosphate pyrophosphokinase-like domain-containing protein [Cupriavidus necator]
MATSTHIPGRAWAPSPLSRPWLAPWSRWPSPAVSAGTAGRLLQPVAGCEAMVVCTLDRPDARLVPLLWPAAAAREGGAVRVGLVAPYLAYMRQDKLFPTGCKRSRPTLSRATPLRTHPTAFP